MLTSRLVTVSLCSVVALSLLLAIVSLTQAQALPIQPPYKLTPEDKAKLKEVYQEIEEKLNIEALPAKERVRRILERMMEGRVNITLPTHYIPRFPVFPEIVCPPAAWMDLPYKPYVAKLRGKVMRYLAKNNISLQEFCQSEEKAREIVSEALKHINASKICFGLEKASERCKKLRALKCEGIEKALAKCYERLKECKRKEKIVRILNEARWRKEMEKLKRMVETQGVLISQVERSEGTENSSSEAEIAPIIKPPTMVRGVIPKCYLEEKLCQHLEKKLKRCIIFKEKCMPNCERLDRLAEECKRFIQDTALFVDKVTELAMKKCKLANLTLVIPRPTNETLPPSEILPIVVVTQPLSSDEEKTLSGMVSKLRKVYEGNRTWIYRGFVRASDMEKVRELEFVKAVKVDHLLRSVMKGAIKKTLPRVPKIAEKLGTLLPRLEHLKETEVDEEVKPVIEDVEANVVNVTEDLAKKEDEEKRRGIGYKILKFLGLKAGQEKKDAEFLKKRAEALKGVRARLKKIAEIQASPVVKALMMEEIKKLDETIKSIEKKAAEKRRRAFGLWSFLGLR